MVRDTIQLEDVVSTISQEYLLEFTSEYDIPESLHPELPGPEEPIVEFSEGKVGVYTKFFEFANFRWMSFSERSGNNTPQCYTKPLDSLKNWNNRFFWVDEKIFPTVVEWFTNAPKDGMSSADSYSAADYTSNSCVNADMDLFNLISAPNPTKVKTETRPCAAHEVLLFTATASRVIDIEDTTVTSGSLGTPAALEKSLLDFADENPPSLITEGNEMKDRAHDGLSREIPIENPTTTKVVPEPDLEKEVAAMGPLVNKRRRKRGNDEVDANAPPKVLRKDHVSFRPAHSTHRVKSIASIGLEVGSTFFTPDTQETHADVRSVSDPDPLSYAKPQPHLKRDVAQSSRKTAAEIPTENVATTEVQGQIFVESPKSGKSASFPSAGGSPGNIYQLEWGVTKNRRLDTSDVCQDMVDHIVPPGYFSELCHLPNTEFLSQYNIILVRQVAMGSQLRLRFEQEVKLLKKATAKIARQDQRIQAREEEIKKLDQEIKSLRAMEAEVHGL
ncbi:hypothetical protein Tco_1507572 [Tanacetum coccineum]